MMVFYVRVVAGLVITTNERPSSHVALIGLAGVQCVAVEEQNIT